MMVTLDIPKGVYWSQEALNFYSEESRLGMGVDFFDKWQHLRRFFPTRSESMEGE
jgi:hypothetical protein